MIERQKKVRVNKKHFNLTLQLRERRIHFQFTLWWLKLRIMENKNRRIRFKEHLSDPTIKKERANSQFPVYMMTVEARDSGGPAKTNTATTRLVIKCANNISSNFVHYHPPRH